MCLHPFLIQPLLPKHSRTRATCTPTGIPWLRPTNTDKGEPGIVAGGCHECGGHVQASSFPGSVSPDRKTGRVAEAPAQQEPLKEMFTESI